MTDWTAGKVLFAGVWAAGAALLVGKAIQSFRASPGSSSSSEPPRPPPRLPRPPQPSPSSTGPGWEPGPSNAGRRHYEPMVERWRGPIAARMGDDQHLVDAALRWVEIESRGDTCSTGIAGREAGIFQLDFPGDGKYGATFAGLMDICKRSHGTKLGDLSWMTPADMDMEVGAGVRKFKAAVDYVRKVFADNGVTWPENTFDFGAAVKQVHASPAVLGELLPKIAHRDGPPASWKELHQKVMEIPADQMSGVDKNGHPYGLRLLALSPSKHGLKNRLEDTLRNSEEFAIGWPTSSNTGDDVELEVTDVSPA